MMQTRLGTAGGAATQMVVILTSLAYMARVRHRFRGHRRWSGHPSAGSARLALRVGNRVILLAGLLHGRYRVLIALGGPWVLPFFCRLARCRAATAVALSACSLLWLAAGYQFFDGLESRRSMWPARARSRCQDPGVLVLTVSLLGCSCRWRMPSRFRPDRAGCTYLPQFGWGAVGGWVRYSSMSWCSGGTLFLRALTGPGRTYRL